MGLGLEKDYQALFKSNGAVISGTRGPAATVLIF
jgi:hypothetical protein